MDLFGDLFGNPSRRQEELDYQTSGYLHQSEGTGNDTCGGEDLFSVQQMDAEIRDSHGVSGGLFAGGTDFDGGGGPSAPEPVHQSEGNRDSPFYDLFGGGSLFDAPRAAIETHDNHALSGGLLGGVSTTQAAALIVCYLCILCFRSVYFQNSEGDGAQRERGHAFPDRQSRVMPSSIVCYLHFLCVSSEYYLETRL